MMDLFSVSLTTFSFLLFFGFLHFCNKVIEKKESSSMLLFIIVGALSLYLVHALIYPEKY